MADVIILKYTLKQYIQACFLQLFATLHEYIDTSKTDEILYSGMPGSETFFPSRVGIFWTMRTKIISSVQQGVCNSNYCMFHAFMKLAVCLPRPSRYHCLSVNRVVAWRVYCHAIMARNELEITPNVMLTIHRLLYFTNHVSCKHMMCEHSIGIWTCKWCVLLLFTIFLFFDIRAVTSIFEASTQVGNGFEFDGISPNICEIFVRLWPYKSVNQPFWFFKWRLWHLKRF